MNTLKILSFIVFSLFLVSTVNAINVYGDWEDKSQSIEIDEEETISFNVDFGSANPPMDISVILYDLNSNFEYIFEEKIVDYYSFYRIYEIDEDIYEKTGNYEIIILGYDNTGDFNSVTLDLKVIEEDEDDYEDKKERKIYGDYLDKKKYFEQSKPKVIIDNKKVEQFEEVRELKQTDLVIWTLLALIVLITIVIAIISLRK